MAESVDEPASHAAECAYKMTNMDNLQVFTLDMTQHTLKND